jgi:hypothetical protein
MIFGFWSPLLDINDGADGSDDHFAIQLIDFASHDGGDVERYSH